MSSSQQPGNTLEGSVIAAATAKDVRQVVDLARETFYDTWSHVNTDEDLALFMDEAFDPGKVAMEIDHAESFTFLLVWSDGVPAGYAKLRRDSVFEELPDVRLLEIEKFYFRKQFFGSGLADLLMDRVLRISREERVDWICLGVDVNNHRAARFYSRHGFQVFGKKSFRVGNQVDTDNLMKRRP